MFQRTEHASVFHVVSVQNRVAVVKIGDVVPLHKNAAGFRRISIEIGMQAGLVIPGIQNGIIDLLYIVKINPAGHIRICFL